jgi:hypothetical protein
MKDYGIAGAEVGGYDGHRHHQIFEGLAIEKIAYQSGQSIITGQSHTRNPPAREVLESDMAANVRHARQTDAARVGGAQNTPYARTGDA